MKRNTLFLALLSGLTLSSTAQAALIDRGSGLIYDNALDITWLATGLNKDTWAGANAWAAGLTYGGYTGWRLPTTLQPDQSCSDQYPAYGLSLGSHCAGSEMGHLFYADLGGTAGLSILNSSDPDLKLFPNIKADAYWSGTPYVPPPPDASQFAWLFYMNSGYQSVDTTNGVYYVMAVHPGDVGAATGLVPEPTTLALLGLGLSGLGLVRRRGGWGHPLQKGQPRS